MFKLSLCVLVMPRVRQRIPFQQLTPFERGRIVGMRECGKSFKEIARQLGRSDLTVRRAWNAWILENRSDRKIGSGRPRVSTEREDRLLRRSALQDPIETSRSVGANWMRAVDHRVSMRTVYRRIHSFKLFSYRPHFRLPLTREHMRARLEWCIERDQWGEGWNHVIFSDESRFCLWKSDGRLRVRRRRNDRRDLASVQRRHTGLTPGVMVWGAISLGHRSPLVFIDGSLNARRYINLVLQPVLLPYIQQIPGSTFQQDNARAHTAVMTRDFLQMNNVLVLPWPARSPDLSPIEHVWDMMGRRLQHLRRPPNTLVELRQQVEIAWNEIPQEDIDSLISGMPRRTAECIRVRGDATHY